MTDNRNARLRAMLRRDSMVVAPFCLNALHAKIAESVGFNAVYMTGSGTSAEKGFADVGLLTQTEMVANARYIANAVDVPVVADADTGYGNAINVWRTVHEYESIGVSGIHIEDQVFPKKCGFFAGKDVIPMEEHVQKVRAALDARRDPDFVIIARTDALAVNGWEDTVRRCRAYRDAGADLVFVDGVKTKEDLETYATALAGIPKVFNGADPVATTGEVNALGFDLMLAGYTLTVVYEAVKRAMEELRDTGAISTPQHRAEIADMLGLQRVYEMEAEYAV
ncbi:MAG: isocitrate lyase/PEP mutase family protein [Chloroflexota bacterium]|nr:isocitrate lyase/PEP mutase family protein [Chloroflexota bacterium]